MPAGDAGAIALVASADDQEDDADDDNLESSMRYVLSNIVYLFSILDAGE